MMFEIVFEWSVQECYLPLHTDLSEEQKALFDFCIVDMTVSFFLLFFYDP